MSTRWRRQVRDVAVVAALCVSGLVVTVGILRGQGLSFPAWVPVLGEQRFELKAEFDTAQAVTPGQGQTVDLAGVKVGDVTDVSLNQGTAVVTMEIDESDAPQIRSDATLMLRPRTALQDMTIEVDPGRSSEPVGDGDTIPVSRTEPQVNADQILASLDGDTRSYLQLLLQAGGQGLDHRGKKLSSTLRRFEPLTRDVARIGRALAQRRRNIRDAITSFRLVSEALASSDTDLAGFVDSSSAVLRSFADQQDAIRGSLEKLPSTLRRSRAALAAGDRFARELGPASRELTPAARALGPALRDVRRLAEETTKPIREQIRPFARAAQKPVRHLRQAAAPLAQTADGAGGTFSELNVLANAAAYNPPGSAEEGYLFWLAWLNHNANAVFFSQDAMGPMARGVVILGCGTAGLAEGVAAARPFLRTLQQITNVPTSDDPRVCPSL